MRTGLLAPLGLLLFAAVTPALAAPATQGKATNTISDLKAAYKGETTAHAKYAAYARQADKEGYPDVATLFRAASRAEEVHARNHKAALAALGVKNPVPGAYAAKPGTTKACLADAIKGETYERDTMYPKMLKDAAQEKQRGATRTFTYAREAEKQHAQLYTIALNSLQKNRAVPTFYVCPVCGATYLNKAPAYCNTCGTRRERFTVFKGPVTEGTRV